MCMLRNIVWSMLVLMPLIGVTWILGLVFVVYEEESTALAGIFITLNILQVRLCHKLDNKINATILKQ